MEIENKISDLNNFYSDIIVTAVEGGIGYWSRCSDYDHGYKWNEDCESRHQPASVTVHELDDERADTYKAGVKVTTKEIAKAMRRIADFEQQIEYAGEEWRGRMAGALREKDAYDIDAADADAIMQIAVLGSITYG